MSRNRYSKLFIKIFFICALGTVLCGCAIEGDINDLIGSITGRQEVISEESIEADTDNGEIVSEDAITGQADTDIVSTENDTEENKESDEIDEIDEDADLGGEDEQMREPEGYGISVAWSAHSILDIENDQKVILRTEDDVRVTAVTASDDTVYAILTDTNVYRGHHWVVAIDREKSIDDETGEEYYPITKVDELEGVGPVAIRSYNIAGLGYYNDTLYIQYKIERMGSGRGSTYRCSYIRQEDGSYQKTQDELCMLIDELKTQYSSGYVRGFAESMAYLAEKDMMLFQDYTTVYFIDAEGNIMQEYTIDKEAYPGLMVQMLGEQLLLGSNQDNTYYVYDMDDGENGSLKPVNYNDSSYYIVKVSNDYVYYYKQVSSGYEFYRVGIDAGEEELLFEIETVPGQPSIRLDDCDFAVWNDRMYFVNFDEGALWWFSCDLSDEDHTITRLDVADDYNGIFDMVSVDTVSKTYYCGRCGEWIYSYSIDDVQLSDTSIPHWEEINEILRERTDDWIEVEDDEGQNHYGFGIAVTDPSLIDADEETVQNHSSHTDYVTLSSKTTFEGITVCTLESIDGNERYDCLEIGYYSNERAYENNYSRTFRTRLFFDLSDGSEIDLGDICSLSKEEFRTLVAAYTLADYQNDNVEYSYFTDEEEVYSDAYNYGNFGCLMSLTPEGVEIIYQPDTQGDWFIEVTIPYEELGLRLVEIHGTNGNKELTEDEKIFMSFLNGGTNAAFEEDFQCDLSYICADWDYDNDTGSYSVTYAFDFTDPLSYEQFISIVESSGNGLLHPGEVERSYAVIDTMSGRQVLAVKFRNISTNVPEAGYAYALFLFAVNDGQLYMTYAYDSWSRHDINIYDNLIFAGAGFSGAGDGSGWCGLIDETGHYKMVYDQRFLYGSWIRDYDMETFHMDIRWSEYSQFTFLTTSDGSYYWYEVEDSVDPEQLAIYISHLEKNGLTHIDNADDAVNDALEANGIVIDDLSEFDGWIMLN